MSVVWNNGDGDNELADVGGLISQWPPLLQREAAGSNASDESVRSRVRQRRISTIPRLLPVLGSMVRMACQRSRSGTQTVG